MSSREKGRGDGLHCALGVGYTGDRRRYDERVRVSFAFDRFDCVAMGPQFTIAAGTTSRDVPDLVVACVQYWFGRVKQVPHAILWRTENDSRDLGCETLNSSKEAAFSDYE